MPENVASLMRQLSRTNFLHWLPLKAEPARWFYAHQSAAEQWSVRELRRQIDRKAFGRGVRQCPKPRSTRLAISAAPRRACHHGNP
ncbi:MAG TPA: DUF1016 N-terminal domain-containing protein [Ideonella sp.]|nr:DUF1016 N-terminal domain-containing protein [Ideonella sp.]